MAGQGLLAMVSATGPRKDARAAPVSRARPRGSAFTSVAQVGYLVAIDAGTTGVRALVVDEQAEVVDVASRELTQYFPRPGWVEHSATEIWEAVCTTLAEVGGRLADTGRTVAAIGVTNQRDAGGVRPVVRESLCTGPSSGRTGARRTSVPSWRVRDTCPWCERGRG